MKPTGCSMAKCQKVNKFDGRLNGFLVNFMVFLCLQQHKVLLGLMSSNCLTVCLKNNKKKLFFDFSLHKTQFLRLIYGKKKKRFKKFHKIIFSDFSDR